MDAGSRTRHLPTSRRAVKRNVETGIGQRLPQASLSFSPKIGYLLWLAVAWTSADIATLLEQKNRL
jgi:hypothetical protein